MQTAFIVAYMLFSLLFGYVGDRFNRTIVISIGILSWSAVMMASSFVGPSVSLISLFYCMSVNSCFFASAPVRAKDTICNAVVMSVLLSI